MDFLDIIDEHLKSINDVYQKAFEAGRKAGYDEGYRVAHQEFKEALFEEKSA